VPLRRRIGHKHADLAVLDPPGGATVLPLDADRLGPLFEKAVLVDDEHGPRVAQMLQDIGA
jgi:hypothetical protein